MEKSKKSIVMWAKIFLTAQTILTTMLAVLVTILFGYHTFFNSIKLFPAIMLGLLCAVVYRMMWLTIREIKQEYQSQK